MYSEVNVRTEETGILVTVEQLQGYEALQKEEVGQTLALLQIVNEQIEGCQTTDEIEAVFDATLKADPKGNLEDYVERRICRAITLVGLMSRTPVPKRFVLIDEIVYKAAGVLLSHQQQLQAGDVATQQTAETVAQ